MSCRNLKVFTLHLKQISQCKVKNFDFKGLEGVLMYTFKPYMIYNSSRSCSDTTFFIQGTYPIYYEKYKKELFIAHFNDNNGMYGLLYKLIDI